MEIKNYITPAGFEKLRKEYTELLNVERPKLVVTVAWAASNGDRSENADYIYGKRRMREIARMILPLHGMPGWDYVLVARPGVTVTRDFAGLQDDILAALRAIHKGPRP